MLGSRLFRRYAACYRVVMGTVYLICGQQGAGKTTCAIRLASERSAVRFSLDDWIMGLFGSEAPEPMQGQWWIERAERCSLQIWQVCRRLLDLGTDVVLDFGFAAHAHRQRFRELAAAAGARVELHVVTADVEERRTRVQARNVEKAETFALVVTEYMFDSFQFEPLAGDELLETTVLHG